MLDQVNVFDKWQISANVCYVQLYTFIVLLMMIKLIWTIIHFPFLEGYFRKSPLAKEESAFSLEKVRLIIIFSEDLPAQ